MVPQVPNGSSVIYIQAYVQYITEYIHTAHTAVFLIENTIKSTTYNKK